MREYLVDSLIWFPLGAVASLLPRRLWNSVEDWVPIPRGAATASSIVSVVAAVVITAAGYLAYVDGIDNMAAAAAAPLAFIFGTPTGWIAIYLMGTGTFRTWYALFDDPVGDPALTVIDTAWLMRRRRRDDARRRREREALEGQEVADRLLEGPTAGFPHAQWVVVASRRKQEWTAGTFVHAGDKWYKLHEPVDRQLPIGLRVFYPMSEAAELEVIRRSVEYDLPLPTRAAGSPPQP